MAMALTPVHIKYYMINFNIISYYSSVSTVVTILVIVVINTQTDLRAVQGWISLLPVDIISLKMGKKVEAVRFIFIDTIELYSTFNL
jgi:hypothetical protein